jgi:flagellar protein FlaJ
MYPNLEPDYLLAGAIFAFALIVVYVGLFVDLMFSALLGVLVFDLTLGYPIYSRDKRIDAVEARLPDILQHMATTLKAGGTIEAALHDVSKVEYGPITRDMRTMLRELQEGKTFEDAFTSFADRTESILVMRSANIIVSAKRTGGGLVRALASIADDMRETLHIKREREARTMIQVIFIVIAGCIVAPFIFGLVSGIMVFLAGIGGQSASPVFGTLVFYFKGYLVVSAIFSAIAAAMIKEGKVTKAVIYAPALLLLTYTIFWVVSTFANSFFMP